VISEGWGTGAMGGHRFGGTSGEGWGKSPAKAFAQAEVMLRADNRKSECADWCPLLTQMWLYKNGKLVLSDFH